jgi:hypothetical protein
MEVYHASGSRAVLGEGQMPEFHALRRFGMMTCLTADCCFSEPTLYIIQRVGLVQSRHNYRFLEILLTYFRYDIAKQCSFGAKNNHLLEFKRTFLRELEGTIYKWGKRWVIRVNDFWLPLKTYGESFCRGYNAPTIFWKSTNKIVLSVQGEWHSPNTLSTMLHACRSSAKQT